MPYKIAICEKEKYLEITFEHEFELVPLSQIIYIEAQKQYVSIHAINNVASEDGGFTAEILLPIE